MTRAFAATAGAGPVELLPVELPEDRRRECRVPAGTIPARVRTGENTETRAAHVLDISTSGLRIRLSSPLETGVEATIWFGRTVATGRIRYCRTTGEGLFEAGVCLTDALSTV